MKWLIVYVLLIQIIIVSTIKGQTITKSSISVLVQDHENRIIEGATVYLLNARDSSVKKTAVTDKTGIASFESINQGNYLIKTIMTGYKTTLSALFSFNGTEPYRAGNVIIYPDQKELANVVVETRKPFIERKIDRLVVNVENSIISAGSSAFEVLERSPGIVIDQNDNLSLKGRSGVIIMIDGKLSPLSGSDLASMLRGLPANAIEKIEIIANPSSRFDAAGNAGIINIIMKKDKRMGSNGTLSLGMGQGIYNRTNGGLNMNFRDKKVNVFGNYNYAYRKPLNDLWINRNFYNNNGQIASGLDLFNNMLYPTHTHTLRLGIDYFINRKTIVGVLLNGLINDQDKKVVNASTVKGASGIPLSFMSTNSFTADLLKHHGLNVNIKHSIDSLGQEITFDFDRAVFDKTSNPDFSTTYYDLNYTPNRPTYLLEGHMAGFLSIHSIKSDYTKPLSKNGKLEAGFKMSFVNADNDLKFFDKSGGTLVYETNRSNHFIYDENINAAYISINKEWNKVGIQVGLRAEQANIKAVQKVTNERIDTSYLRLFPSAFFTYKLNQHHELGFSYSRRITRPTYSQLNPFKSFIDLTSYNTGNPYLRPEFIHSLELSYTLRQKTTFSFSYARATDVISWVIKPVNTPDGPVSVETNDNISTNDFFGLNVSNQHSFTKWWNSVTNINIFKIQANGIVENTAASNSGIVYNINSNHSFTLPKRWSGELSLNYQGAQQSAFAYSLPQWMLSAGIQKVIMKGRATLRFNVSDIFRTFYPRVTSTFVSYQQYFTAVRDTRIASLNFIYRFGKNTVTAARRRVTGVEDEKSRAQ